ncbi:MAG: DNA-directed RNA polymerase subunit beta' [bacterium]
MVINLKEEVEKIMKVSINKLESILSKHKDKAESIERAINLDIGSKLSGVKDKSIQKKIKRELDNILKLSIYPFISGLEDLIEKSSTYPDYTSFLDSYKFPTKEFKKILNEHNQIMDNLASIEENQEFVEENLHLVREIKNLYTDLVEYKISLTEVINIIDIVENLKKLRSDFEYKVSNDVKKWKEEYLQTIKEYEELKKEYNKSRLIESSKEKVSENNKGIKDKNEIVNILKEKEAKILEQLGYFIQNIFSTIDSKFIQKVVRMLSDNFTVFFKLETGAEPIRELLSRIDLEKEREEIKKLLTTTKKGDKKLLRRLGVINSFIKGNVRPEWMVLEVLPVLPAELRPIVRLEGGKFASSDLNDLYRRIINRNNRLKRLIEIQAPEIIINNEKRMLQKAVDALIDNSKTDRPLAVSNRRILKSLSDNIQGKQGRFRYNLLGKRVDYSGRSVIVVNPKLKFYECGLPEEMVLELFKPFIINKLIEDGKADNIKKAKKMIEQRNPEIWPTVQKVVENFPVILNRAPTLHRLSIQAFYPRIVKTKAIQIHPLVCSPYNADFDGDQMAVHIPLSVEAMLEYRNILLSINNMLIPANGEPANVPSQDMVLGAFWLTYEDKKPDPKEVNIYVSSYEEAYRRYFELKESLHTWVYYKVDFSKLANKPSEVVEYNENKVLTTIGRIIFNNSIRKHIPEFPFINFTVGKKELKWIVEECIYTYGMHKTQPVLDELKEIGFLFATRSGTTISIDELVIPPNKQAIISKASEQELVWEEMYSMGLLNDEERKRKIIDTWYDATDKVTDDFKSHMSEHMPLNSIWMLANSGARGNVDQAKQLVAIRGLMVNPKGEIIPLPIKNSFTEGLGVFDYFIASHGGRKGLVDTALRTADAGYLTRKLVDVAQDVVVREEDCQTEEYIVIKPIKIVHYTLEPEMIEVEKSFGKVLAENIPNVAEKYQTIDFTIYQKLKQSQKDKVSVFMEEEILPLVNRIRGRVAAQDFIDPITNQIIVRKGELIDRNKAKQVAKYYTEAKVRSVLKCKVFKGVCKKCYGEDLGLGNRLIDLGEAVGIIAAQSIGEPGTQLTLRTFHTGGVALDYDIIQGIPRVQELLEIRKKTKYHSSLFAVEDSRVVRIENKTTSNVVVLKGLETGKEYYIEVPLTRKLAVNEGQVITAGTTIIVGTISPKEFIEKVIEKVREENKDNEIDIIHHPQVKKAIEISQMYVLDEMQKVYLSQGVFIHDKHMEIIIRQMFRFVKIDDPGDSTLMYGELVDKFVVEYLNNIIARKGGKLIRALPEVLGISKAALTSESWLSSASFQEITRMISYAAISGKKDHLTGLKENIIIGKPVPVGTNYSLYKNVSIEEVVEEKV